MSISQYIPVLRTPGVLSVIVAQLVARLPAGMMAIAVLFQVQAVAGSFGVAGLAIAMLSVGQAISGPVNGRAVGRWGTRPVVLACAGVSALALATLALLPLLIGALPLPVLLTLTGCIGLAGPPVQSAVRTLYGRLVPPDRLRLLLALDASLQELIFVVAPVAITLVVAWLGASAGVLFVASVLLLGCVWFALLPLVGQVKIPRSPRRLGAVARKPAVIVGALVGLALVAASSALEIVVIAAHPEDKIVAGLLLALYSVTSLIGGIVLGARSLARWSLTGRLLIVVAGLATCAWQPNPLGVAIGLFIAGLGVAPALAVTYLLVSETVEFGESAEAFGWLGTGVLLGASAGAAGAGMALDLLGVGGGFALAAGAAAAAVIIAAVAGLVAPHPRSP